MNIRRLKSRLINFPSGKVCFGLLIIYAFMCCGELDYAVSMHMSVWEYVLYTLTDHYYLIYAWLFFLIFFSARKVMEKSLVERVRYGTVREYYFLEGMAKAIQIAAVIASHAAISFLIGFTKLEFCNVFIASMSAQITDNNLEVIAAYASFFKTPVSAAFSVLAYWTAGSIFISGIIYYCSEIWQKKGMLVCIMLVLVSTMSGFMTDMDEGIFEFLFLNNYYILHHALLNIGFIWMAVNIGFMMIGMMLLEKFAISKGRNKCTKAKVSFKVIFAARSVTCIVFFAVLVLLGAIGGGNDAYSVIWSIVKGFSYQDFRLMEFLYYIAPALFVLFFINAAWEKEAGSRNELLMFRVGSRKKWNRIMEKSCVNFLAKNCMAYIVMIVLAALSGMMMFGTGNRDWQQGMAEYYRVTNPEILYSILAALLLRVLELYLLYHIDRFVYVLTNHSVSAYIITFAFYIPEIAFGEMDMSLLGKGSAYQIVELFAVKHEFVIPAMAVTAAMFILILNFASHNKKLITRKETSLCQK